MSVSDNADQERVFAANIVEQLQKVNDQPDKFLGDTDPANLLMWLEGFNTACGVFGFQQGYVHHDAILKLVAMERGWEYRSTGLVSEMQERRMRDELIIEEILTIEIETWKRTYGLA